MTTKRKAARTTTPEAAPKTHTNGVDSATTDPSVKAVSTQVDLLKRAGHTVHQGHHGDFTVCKYGMTRYCADFTELQAFAQQVGVRSPASSKGDVTGVTGVQPNEHAGSAVTSPQNHDVTGVTKPPQKPQDPDQPGNQAAESAHPLPTSPEKLAALADILKANPGTSAAVQCTRIRTALSQFSITTFEAMRFLDCYDARARVVQLRKAGEVIDTHRITIITESGDRHRVGLYVLKGGAS